MNTMVETIKNYFDSREWKYYEKAIDENLTAFFLSFSADHEQLTVRVNAFHKRRLCHIMCWPEAKFDPVNFAGAAVAMNDLNRRSLLVSGHVDKDGTIGFSLGYGCESDDFSEDLFAENFDTIFQVADEETAQIIKKVSQYRIKKSRNLFSFFK